MYDLLLIKTLSDYDLQYIPPLGLGFISGYLKKQGFSVRILDCNVLGITSKELSLHVSLEDYRLIGFQAYDMDLRQVAEYIGQVRNQNPTVPVIVGGPAPSSNPEFVFRFLEQADYLCAGEGEVTLEKLLTFLKRKEKQRQALKQIPNLAWRENGGVYTTRHEYVSDLDIIGQPDWAELNPDLYGNAVHGFFYRRLPALPIMVSRGCPFRCSFCGSRNVSGYKVRRRSADRVLDELTYLKNEHGLREFQVVDDNFTFPNNAALEFSEKLIQRKLDLLWTCPNGLRLDTLDEKLLKAMKASGCYEIAVGIESGDVAILKDMGKHLKPEKVREQINLIRLQGINIVGFVMLGYPLETIETLKKTMQFILSLPLVRISLTRFIPMPGTPITDRLIAAGEITYEQMDPSKLHHGNFSYIPSKLTEKQLNYWYKLFFLRFLLRWKVLSHNLRNIRSLSHAKIVFRKILWYLK